MMISVGELKQVLGFLPDSVTLDFGGQTAASPKLDARATKTKTKTKPIKANGEDKPVKRTRRPRGSGRVLVAHDENFVDLVNQYRSTSQAAQVLNLDINPGPFREKLKGGPQKVGDFWFKLV